MNLLEIILQIKNQSPEKVSASRTLYSFQCKGTKIRNLTYFIFWLLYYFISK